MTPAIHGRKGRREFLRTVIARMGILGFGAHLLSRSAASDRRAWHVGHHFWNWDHRWNCAESFGKRLALTRETGYEGFEAKPHEIGVPGEVVRERCAKYGVQCVAIGAGGEEGIDYAHAAGASIVRTKVPREQTKRWVEYAGERGITIVVHPHVARAGAVEPVETREDLLRYLDDRPGVFACPDTGHLALCGSDPVQTILDLGERCRYVHLKDIRPERVGVKHAKGEKFCELGAGALDLVGVIKALENIDYRGWIMVERDSREADYVRSARNMRRVLKRMGC